MNRAERAALYRKCAAGGLTIAETAKRLGVTYDAARRWFLAHPDVVGPSKRGPPPLSVDTLTPQQYADYRVLLDKGNYSHAAAMATVTRPRVKVRLGVPR
jgi:transposase-like protein